MEKKYIVKPITSEQTYSLKHKILRPNQTLDDCKYELDNCPSSFHSGIFYKDELLGIASIFNESETGEVGEMNWRIRGMAIKIELQGKGLGSAVLKECLNHAKNSLGQTVWCNARTTAVSFYEKLGFVTNGDEFEIEGIGPHYILTARL